ncbi:MAG: radical SAM family heme chaperone HemW [Desulfopila sp.]
MSASLYIHIPFCLSKCDYCSFCSYPDLHALYPRYLQAMKTALRRTADRRDNRLPLTTIFFGGGTPTVLPAEELTGLLGLVKRCFPVSADAEISCEANPGTVDQRYLEQMVAAGFNRLSLGVQSLSDPELAGLGRCHTAQQARATIEGARAAGFTNLSLDLMYGLVGQTLQGWRTTLKTALLLAPDHLSLYQLTIEEGTPLAARAIARGLVLPDEETIVAMDRLNRVLCARSGLKLYEISNFAKPGWHCRHNLNYWQNGEYLAVGAGAVSYLAGVREKRSDDPEGYCRLLEAGGDGVVEREKLDREASFRETVVIGLRMAQGVHRATLQTRFGLDPATSYGPVLGRLQENGLVELTSTHLRLTTRGRRYANLVMAELV